MLNESILKGAWIEKVQKKILLRSSGNSSLILQFRTTHKVNLSNTLYSFFKIFGKSTKSHLATCKQDTGKHEDDKVDSNILILLSW